jgi:predicted aspartyl protease
MGHSLSRFALYGLLLGFLFIPAVTTWAVPFDGTAHSSALSGKTFISLKESFVGQQRQRAIPAAELPRTVSFREAGGRGLLVRVWVNGAGPYTFAVDTGAGATILSRQVANEARIVASGGRPVMLSGMSGAGAVAGQEATLRSLAVGDEQNFLPSKSPVIITERLAPGVDGVLDPAEAYWPLGFEIDMVRGEMTAFDPRRSGISRTQNLPPDGTIVSWLMDKESRRPFVMLEGGRRALLDTGSEFGLAVTTDAARALGIPPGRGRERGDVRDISGGSIQAHKLSPSTVRIGALVLRGIPTDLLSNARAGSPVLLGRDALRPFRISFDPINRLIRIVPG